MGLKIANTIALGDRIAVTLTTIGIVSVATGIIIYKDDKVVHIGYDTHLLGPGDYTTGEFKRDEWHRFTIKQRPPLEELLTHPNEDVRQFAKGQYVV